jgi:hypothetical protein
LRSQAKAGRSTSEADETGRELALKCGEDGIMWESVPPRLASQLPPAAR